MNLTPEQREQIALEVKRFAADLNLTPDQKEKLQTAFQDARGKLGDYMKDHPGVTKADMIKEVAGHRDQIRQRVVNFLNPDQLKKWDSEIAKAKDLLGQQMARDGLTDD
jgi:protein CpxP